MYRLYESERDTLKRELASLPERVRESVKYVLSSETRENLFHKCVEAAGVVKTGG